LSPLILAISGSNMPSGVLGSLSFDGRETHSGFGTETFARLIASLQVSSMLSFESFDANAKPNFLSFMTRMPIPLWVLKRSFWIFQPFLGQPPLFAGFE